MKDITLAVHAGSRKDDVNGAINQPINTTSNHNHALNAWFGQPLQGAISCGSPSRGIE